jgi:hypothetical protein
MYASCLNRVRSNSNLMQLPGRQSDGSPDGSGTRQWPSAFVAVLLVLAAAGGVVSVAPERVPGPVSGVLAQADEEDFAPPDVDRSSAERIDMETIELVVTDNSGVEGGTIQQNDFEVTPGEVVGVSASGSGTEVDVELRIEGADRSAVTISTTNDTRISDVNGNVYTGEFDAIVDAPEGFPSLSDASLVDATRARQYEGSINWPEDRPGEATLIELYLTDDTGIDTATIDSDDFTVSRARIADVVTRTDGANARVLLVLSRNLEPGRLGEGGLTVGLDENATIRDTGGRVGNRIRLPGPDFTLFNEPPRFAGASRVNDTAVQLTFADDTDVAESSIQREEIQVLGADLPAREVSEFGVRNVDPATLREYSIAGIEVTEIGASASAVVAAGEEGYLDGVAEVGSNASVLVRLPRPVDDDELLVRVRPTADIVDTIGNAYDPGDVDVRNRYLVEGMDGVAPELREFSLTRTGTDGAALTLSTTERLGGLDISVQGATTDSLDLPDFAPVEGSEFTYEATYSPAARGTLLFRLNSLSDDAGNTREIDALAVRNGTAREPRPDPVIALDFEASGGETFVFDARHTQAATSVTNYTWEFGDGTTQRGLRARTQFEPGRHLVALTATDSGGRTATETATLDLTAPSVTNVTADQLDGIRRVTAPETRVRRPGEGGGPTRVEVRNPSPGMRVTAGLQDGDSLAAGRDVSLDSVTVVPDRYDDFSLSLSATGPGAIEGATGDVGGQSLGGFAVEHDAPDSDFRQATLAASVDAARVRSLGATPEDVTVFREDGGDWDRLPTSPVSSGSPGTTRLRVESPGFSRFAVVANGTEAGAVEPTPTPGPARNPAATNTSTGATDESEGRTDSGVRVTNATLNRTSVTPGEVVSVTATLTNPGDDNRVFTAGLTVNGSTVDTEQVTLPTGAERTASFRYVVERTGTVPVAVNGTSAGRLSVGGGGLLSSVLGLFAPLAGLASLLPLGLLRPLIAYVGIPALVIYLALKGLALYLGY